VGSLTPHNNGAPREPGEENKLPIISEFTSPGCVCQFAAKSFVNVLNFGEPLFGAEQRHFWR